MATFAFNKTEALLKILELEEKVNKAGKSIGPINAAQYDLAGACALKVKENMVVNNLNLKEQTIKCFIYYQAQK